MTTTDPRARLDEMKYWRDWPNVIAALTAVLSVERDPAADAGQVGDQFDRGYNSGYANAYYEMRTAITDALGGDRG